MDGSKDKCPVCGNRRLWGCKFFNGPRKYFICGTIVTETGEIQMDQKVCKLAAERQGTYFVEVKHAKVAD